jgi:cyclophilin family peptidyl-prolyl cis-trans isomerase
MASRFGITLAICTLAAILGANSLATAQVVRFETSIGSFDMVLNPTNNTRLQGHVDNMLEYIDRGTYNGVWINRADVNNNNPFVLQMGGFYSHTKRPPATLDSTRRVATLDPVIGSPGIPGLSNTVGTVSMALSGLPTGGTNRNSGTTSFFVNATSNTFLDTDFTVFAAISDMTVINEIMDLMKLDRTTDPNFGADPGDLTFTDVPIQDDGKQVFIKRAFVITDTMTIAQATAGVQSIMAESAATAAASSAGGGSSAMRLSSTAVPEPSTALWLIGTFLMLGFRRSRSN